MHLSPYGILDDEDRFKEGDEVRNITPPSHLSQYCDPENDYDRMKWQVVTKYWIRKKFGTYRKGMRGDVEGRRLLN